MVKALSSFLLATFLFFFLATSARAAFVTVNDKGETVWNVLSAQDSLALGAASRGEISIKDSIDGSSTITLVNQDGKVYLNQTDVTDYTDDLVQVEERGGVKEVLIGTDGDKFTIEQNGVRALTSSAINIRPQQNELSVTTSSGNVFLGVLPLEAAESALRSRFVSRISNKNLEITESDTGILAYKIEGEKVINLLNFYEMPIPVTTQVSASTGEILSVDGPEWFKIFGFLFS